MKKISILCVVILIALSALAAVAGCASPEPAIPAHYTTYTKEGVFSISYPPEWEPVFYLMLDMEYGAREYIESVQEGLPLERGAIMFIGGKAVAEGYMPNVSVMVECFPEVNTQDEAVEAEILGMKTMCESYRELSRIQTIIDGKEATIIEYEATHPVFGTSHNLGMIMRVEKYVWGMTCTPPSGEFSKWEDDFNAIVRSLRILH